jgi:hypothetical protein
MVQIRDIKQKQLRRHAVTAALLRASLPACATTTCVAIMLVAWGKEVAP